MAFCFNSTCSEPKNEPDAVTCAACNTSLILHDRYRAHRIIGQGGFGRTILAYDIQLPGHPTCVIKQLQTLSKEPNIVAKSKELFQREAETLGKVGNHPHLPRLLDYFSKDQEFYLVQEYIGGLTLQQEMRHSGKFTEAKIWALLRDLLPTLDYLHQKKIIHRDIKPTNIIRRKLDNKLILIDFGAVKETVHQSIMNELPQELAEPSATVVGTVGFAPPEQMARRPVFASDLYSLAMTCLYLMTATPPANFDYDQQTGELAWQAEVTISPPLTQILEQMLKASVRDRYPSAQAALADLKTQANRRKTNAQAAVPNRSDTPASNVPASAQKTSQAVITENQLPSSLTANLSAASQERSGLPSSIAKTQSSSHRKSSKPAHLSVSLPALSELISSPTNTKKYAWWNRPLLGNYGLTESLVLMLRKQPVSERAVQLHQKAMLEIDKITQSALAIDSDRFGNQEFAAYVRLKYILGQGSEDYESFNQSIELLRVGIKAKDSYLKIEQTEIAFRGKGQQAFYDYVESLLNEEISMDRFRNQCQSKLESLLPSLKSEEGKNALTTYNEHLRSLANHELGLYLLSLFKKYQLSNYSVLDTVAKIVHSLSKTELFEFKTLVSQVIAEQQTFDQLGDMIGIPESKKSPETYAQMLQFIALSEKYKSAYPMFQELVKLLEQWYKHYSSVFSIRQEYNGREYKRPKAFTQTIPGIDLYRKYEAYFASHAA